jgi:hypothetical protein
MEVGQMEVGKKYLRITFVKGQGDLCRSIRFMGGTALQAGSSRV